MTEQDLIAELNKKIASQTLQSGTLKYIEKIKILDSQLISHQKEISSLSDKIKAEEASIMRLRGAVSAFLELCAEEEGLTDKPAAPATPPA